MERGIRPCHRSFRLRRTPGAAVGSLALAGALVLSSCSGSTEPTAEAAATTTVAPTTSRPATTTSTTSPPTTAATTTTTEAPPTTTTTTPETTSTLPMLQPNTTTTVEEQPSEPIAPPSDSYASEPVIEMGTIAIPKIGASMTMYEGIRMTTLDYGPGHWPGTALPGQAGNVVVGGHRTSKHAVFRHVDQLVAGDEIIFEDANGRHVYEVSRVEVVDPTAVWIVNPTDTPQATLFACHPPGSTAQRIVVFSDLVS